MAPTTPADAVEALAALERTVARHGDQTTYLDREPHARQGVFGDGFTACKYVLDDAPCCLVGVVLHEEFDVPLDLLRKIESKKPDSPLAREVLEPYATPEALAVLTEAQRTQDKGGTWGAAVSKAMIAARRWVTL